MSLRGTLLSKDFECTLSVIYVFFARHLLLINKVKRQNSSDLDLIPFDGLPQLLLMILMLVEAKAKVKVSRNIHHAVNTLIYGDGVVGVWGRVEGEDERDLALTSPLVRSSLVGCCYPVAKPH